MSALKTTLVILLVLAFCVLIGKAIERGGK